MFQKFSSNTRAHVLLMNLSQASDVQKSSRGLSPKTNRTISSLENIDTSQCPMKKGWRKLCVVEIWPETTNLSPLKTRVISFNQWNLSSSSKQGLRSRFYACPNRSTNKNAHTNMAGLSFPTFVSWFRGFAANQSKPLRKNIRSYMSIYIYIHVHSFESGTWWF